MLANDGDVGLVQSLWKRLLLFIDNRRDFQNVVEFEIANFAEENFNLKFNTVSRKVALILVA